MKNDGVEAALDHLRQVDLRVESAACSCASAVKLRGLMSLCVSSAITLS